MPALPFRYHLQCRSADSLREGRQPCERMASGGIWTRIAGPSSRRVWRGAIREEDSEGGRPQPVHGDEGGHEEQDGDGEEAHARCEPLGALLAQGRPHEGRHGMPRMQQPPRQVPGLQDEELHRCVPGLRAQDVLQDGGVAVRLPEAMPEEGALWIGNPYLDTWDCGGNLAFPMSERATYCDLLFLLREALEVAILETAPGFMPPPAPAGRI